MSLKRVIHISDLLNQDSLEKLLVSFSVAWPVHLEVLIQIVLQCEGVVLPIQNRHLGEQKDGIVSLLLSF